MERIKQVEESKKAGNNDKLERIENRAAFHLTPPTGWLNDPNGLCQIGGVHHIFFQYTPDNPKGGNKSWGHFETRDFVHYQFTGILLEPDTKWDSHGVYSGCALVEEDEIFLYYTGNVKHTGDYDYIYQGREGNTILVTSKDAKTHTPKELLLTNADYPQKLSCHVRDPKVVKVNDTYYMILGARSQEDTGLALLYTSKDKKNWKFYHTISKEHFGYMWECPDIIELSDRQFLSISPQGLEAQEFQYQNVYQSGYFTVDGNLFENNYQLAAFTEWDMGFDFYAPQTYVDEAGRRILIGWMGMPDAEYGHDPSVDVGWQHMLTMPRELTIDVKTGKLRQNPIAEIQQLREHIIYEANDISDGYDSQELPETYALWMEKSDARDFELVMKEHLHLVYNSQCKTIELQFDNDMGAGRTSRKLQFSEGEHLQNLQVYVDMHCVEIFVNDGDYVFTTKYFAKNRNSCLKVEGQCKKTQIYSMKHFEIEMPE